MLIRESASHERRDCDCGCRGGWNERTAAVELENILACVKAGVWKPPQRQRPPEAATNVEAPTFHAFTSNWLQAKIDGVLGERPLDASTESRLPLAAAVPPAADLRRLPD